MTDEDFLQSILSHVDSMDQDAQLVGKLLDNRAESSRGRPNYFYLTDLVNPQQNYWDHIGVSAEYSEKKQKLLAHGNRMETFARIVFSNINEFYVSETTLDGAENGLPGIRGKVDFRLSDSLVEFKTSEFNIESSDDIWEKAPQDIEQLLFYTVLWTYDNNVHYLIYLSEKDPDSLRVFEVTINDPGTLKTKLRSRKSNLERAIEVDDPSLLGRCRYYGHTCEFDEAGICDCEKFDEIDTTYLQNAIKISRNDDLEKRITIAMRTSDSQPQSVGSWDLYTPRKWFSRTFEDQERSDDYVRPQWVRQALETANVTPGLFKNIEYPRISKSVEYKPRRIKFVRKSRTTNRGQEDEWLPAKIIAREWQNPPNRDKLKWQFMQVGCICAAADKSRGLLIVELPNSEADVDVYEISYSDLEGIRQQIHKRLSDIATAIKNDDPTQLPQCPSWMENDCENCYCS